MEIGIDSFAATGSLQASRVATDDAVALSELLDRMQYADEMGLDVFAIGEHYRKEFLDSANIVILAAAAARTKRIRLSSAVTVLSAADPVRVFQNFATLDLISHGRAEICVGRGSFTESFPLFGYSLHDYDALFTEKLELLLQLRGQDTSHGQARIGLHSKTYPSIHARCKIHSPYGLESAAHQRRLPGLAR